MTLEIFSSIHIDMVDICGKFYRNPSIKKDILSHTKQALMDGDNGCQDDQTAYLRTDSLMEEAKHATVCINRSISDNKSKNTY